MPKHRQTNFKGLLVDIDLVDMPEENTPDCENIETFTKGELSSFLGMEKQESSGFTGQVHAIHQLDGDEFVLVGTKLYRL